MYILQSIGLYKTAQANGENGVLAWIPIAREYLIGKMLGDEMNVMDKFTIPKISIIYPVITYGAGIISSILSVIPLIGGLLSFVLSIAIVVFNVLIWIKYSKAMGKNDVGSYILFFLFPWLMVFLTRGTTIQN